MCSSPTFILPRLRGRKEEGGESTTEGTEIPEWKIRIRKINRKSAKWESDT